MAIPAFSPQSHLHFEAHEGAQLELLAPNWNSPPVEREASLVFALSFSPSLVRYLIQTYSNTGDTVFDPFVGSTGLMMIEGKLMGRLPLGLDCNEHVLESTRQKLPFPEDKSSLLLGDARDLSALLADESIDCVITQPPYGGTHKFSKSNPTDLSLFPSRDFLSAIEQVASELYRVLKPDGICAILIGDIKERGRMVPLGFQFVHRFLSRGFSVQNIFDARTPTSQLPTPLNPHEYLIIFQKKQKAPKRPRY